MKLPKAFQNIANSLKYLKEKVQKLTPKEVNSWKTVLIILVCADLFGVYWFLKLKTLGAAILVVLIVCLGFLLFFSRKNPIPTDVQSPKFPWEAPSKLKPNVPVGMKGGNKQKMTEDEEEIEEEEEPEEDIGFDLGLGDSEEVQKRIENALGKPLF